MNTFSIQPGPVNPSVSSNESTAPVGHNQHVVVEVTATDEVHRIRCRLTTPRRHGGSRRRGAIGVLVGE